eukprot:COSAG02_NODE_694_length_18422_cov_19.850188_10_plen_88_part_00
MFFSYELLTKNGKYAKLWCAATYLCTALQSHNTVAAELTLADDSRCGAGMLPTSPCNVVLAHGSLQARRCVKAGQRRCSGALSLSRF